MMLGEDFWYMNERDLSEKEVKGILEAEKKEKEDIDIKKTMDELFPNAWYMKVQERKIKLETLRNHY
jgi:hypothetical protein